MFICQNCNIQVPKNISPYYVILEKRTKKYPKPFKANTHFDHDGKKKSSDDYSIGWEIVKEIRVCSECKNKLSV